MGERMRKGIIERMNGYRRRDDWGSGNVLVMELDNDGQGGWLDPSSVRSSRTVGGAGGLENVSGVQNQRGATYVPKARAGMDCFGENGKPFHECGSHGTG
jgi:hypothetical protein